MTNGQRLGYLALARREHFGGIPGDHSDGEMLGVTLMFKIDGWRDSWMTCRPRGRLGVDVLKSPGRFS